jgi:uncharacterized sulfatase
MAGPPPNFVILLADDLGSGDLSSTGSRTIQTPNLDALARNGMRFDSMYVADSLCTPSRYGLLTGRYPTRGSLGHVISSAKDSRSLQGEQTLADVLGAHGYATAIVGKWHLGHTPSGLPNHHGFQYFFGLPYSNDISPLPLLRNGQEIEPSADIATLTQRYTDEAQRFIAGHTQQPFFLYLAYSMPHRPVAASDHFRGQSRGGLYGDAVQELDWSVGEIVSELQRRGLAANTLVVFASDNGAAKGYGSNGSLRGFKAGPFEGGLRVPAIASWPGRIPAGRVESQPCSMLDWFPTVLHAAGIHPGSAVLDGFDLEPVLAGTGKRASDRFFFSVDGRAKAYRSGRFKVIRESSKTPPQLFDLVSDPQERVDLAPSQSELASSLAAQLAALGEETRADRRGPGGPSKPKLRRPSRVAP